MNSEIRLVVLSDTHLGQDYPVRESKTPRRGEDFFRNYRTVLAFSKSWKAHAVIHTGDLFARPRFSPKILNLAYEPLLPVLEAGIDFLIIPGNHEGSRLPSHPIQKHPRFHLYGHPQTRRFSWNNISFLITGIPYRLERLRTTFPELLDRTEWNSLTTDFRFLLLHQCIDGSSVGPVGFTFRDGENVVQRPHIPRAFDLVLCGHIHRQQELKTPYGTPILFPGSVERTSFSEKEETKGFYTILIRPDVEPPIQWKFNPLPSRPMVDVDLADYSEDQSSILTQLQKDVETTPSGSVLRFKPGAKLVSAGISEKQFREHLPKDRFYKIAYHRERINKSYME